MEVNCIYMYVVLKLFMIAHVLDLYMSLWKRAK